MKLSACGLALTLLSQHDVCPACGWYTHAHAAWKRELARGAIPNPPKVPDDEEGDEEGGSSADEDAEANESRAGERLADLETGAVFGEVTIGVPGDVVELERPPLPSDAPTVIRITGVVPPCSCGQPSVGNGLDGRPICQWCTDNGEDHPPSTSYTGPTSWHWPGHDHVPEGWRHTAEEWHGIVAANRGSGPPSNPMPDISHQVCSHGLIVSVEWPCSQCHAHERIEQPAPSSPAAPPTSPEPVPERSPIVEPEAHTEPHGTIWGWDESMFGNLGDAAPKPVKLPRWRRLARLARLAARFLDDVAGVLDS